MDWLQELAKWEVIKNYIALIILALIFLGGLILCLVEIIKDFYKKHSKKYTYDVYLGKYVKNKHK